MEKLVSPVGLGSEHKYRFKLEAENRFCLLGYGATVVMLCLVYSYEIEAIKFQDVLTYTFLTLGFHGAVQVLGRLGFLSSKRSNVVVSQLAMLN
jgi:hypothetical protein